MVLRLVVAIDIFKNFAAHASSVHPFGFFVTRLAHALLLSYDMGQRRQGLHEREAGEGERWGGSGIGGRILGWGMNRFLPCRDGPRAFFAVPCVALLS
jgi:hypothetical protein